MPSQKEQVINQGASTSAQLQKIEKDKEKKKSSPWIEKYRPQVFEEIMGK